MWCLLFQNCVKPLPLQFHDPSASICRLVQRRDSAITDDSIINHKDKQGWLVSWFSHCRKASTQKEKLCTNQARVNTSLPFPTFVCLVHAACRSDLPCFGGYYQGCCYKGSHDRCCFQVCHSRSFGKHTAIVGESGDTSLQRDLRDPWDSSSSWRSFKWLHASAKRLWFSLILSPQTFPRLCQATARCSTHQLHGPTHDNGWSCCEILGYLQLFFYSSSRLSVCLAHGRHSHLVTRANLRNVLCIKDCACFTIRAIWPQPKPTWSRIALCNYKGDLHVARTLESTWLSACHVSFGTTSLSRMVRWQPFLYTVLGSAFKGASTATRELQWMTFDD